MQGPLYVITMDASGISLAGVQRLRELSYIQFARIQELRTQNAALEQRLEALEAAMANLLQQQTGGEQ